MKPCRVTKSQQNIHYELPYRINTTKAYPLLSENDSTILIHGHENGVSIVWRGGRPFKPSQQTSVVPQKTNGAANAVISLDSDEETESAKLFEDKAEFEDDKPAPDPNYPYPAILQTLDLSFGTAVLHLATLPAALLRVDGPSYGALESLKRNILFVATCGDNTIRLVTLPLTPPSPASKERSEFRNDFSSALAGHGKWSEKVVILSGHQTQANAVSVTVEWQSKGDGKFGSTSEPQIIVASHSKEVSGLLLLFRIPVQSSQSRAEPFQSIHLSSPARSISFNTGLNQENSSHLLVADGMGVCRIYDYKLLIKDLEQTTDSPPAETGTWLISLYAGFHNTKSDAAPQNLGTRAGFGRKNIIDARWVVGGRAIIILLDDGEWAIWDIEGVGPDASKGLLGRHGIKGGSRSEYSISGYLDGTTKTTKSGPPQITSSKFAPMTPGTRKSTEPFGSNIPMAPVHGQISVLDIPSNSATSPAEDTIFLWFGETHFVIPNLSKFWEANARKMGGSNNLFNGPSSSRMIKLDNINLQGERCSAIDQIPRAPKSTLSEMIVIGEHRYIIILSGSATKIQPTENIPHRQALMVRDASGTGTGMELDVLGIEQALTRMENGSGVKRKIF